MAGSVGHIVGTNRPKEDDKGRIRTKSLSSESPAAVRKRDIPSDSETPGSKPKTGVLPLDDGPAWQILPKAGGTVQGLPHHNPKTGGGSSSVRMASTRHPSSFVRRRAVDDASEASAASPKHAPPLPESMTDRRPMSRSRDDRDGGVK